MDYILCSGWQQLGSSHDEPVTQLNLNLHVLKDDQKPNTKLVMASNGQKPALIYIFIEANLGSSFKLVLQKILAKNLKYSNCPF